MSVMSYFNLLVIRSYNTVFTVRVKLCNLHKEGGRKTLATVQLAFLLQQRLTEVNQPDHTLITYPNLDIRSIFHLSGRLELDQLNSMCWQIFINVLNLILIFHIPMLLLILPLQEQIQVH
jgi:hypothetical protein